MRFTVLFAALACVASIASAFQEIGTTQAIEAQVIDARDIPVPTTAFLHARETKGKPLTNGRAQLKRVKKKPLTNRRAQLKRLKKKPLCSVGRPRLSRRVADEDVNFEESSSGIGGAFLVDMGKSFTKKDLMEWTEGKPTGYNVDVHDVDGCSSLHFFDAQNIPSAFHITAGKEKVETRRAAREAKAQDPPATSSVTVFTSAADPFHEKDIRDALAIEFPDGIVINMNRYPMPARGKKMRFSCAVGSTAVTASEYTC